MSADRAIGIARGIAARRQVLAQRGGRLRMFPPDVFDQEWFEAQRGKSVRFRQIAEIEYERSRSWSISPHPLLEPEFLYGTDLNRGGASPLSRYLADRGGSRVLSPVFSEAVWLTRYPEAIDHPGRVLGHFMSVATPETLLPVPPDFPHRVPTWGEYRDAAFARAREHVRQQSFQVDGTVAKFDEEAGRKFVATWLQRPLPEGAPLITVVIPVYNRAAAVLESIESVRRQSLDRWELIVVDDGSTDGTVAAVEAVAATDPRVKVIARSHEGVCAARNAGIAAATGRFIAFLDSDNEWEPDFLRVMVAYLHANRLRAAYCVIDSKRPGGLRYFAFEGTLGHLMIRNFVPMPALVAETELIREIGGFDPWLRRWVDHDLMIRLAQRVDLHMLPFVGMRFTMDQGDQQRISVKESTNWSQVVLAKHLVDWNAAVTKERVPGRVSVLMPIYQDWEMTIRAGRSVLANSGAADVEIIMLENGSRRPVAAILQAEFATEPRVRIVRQTANRMFATASNLAFSESTGEIVIFMNNDTEAQPGWLPPLLDALEDPEVLGAQPLLTYPDGTVQAAGTIFPGDQRLPIHLLAGHPVEDVLKVLPRKFRAVTAATLAMRASDVSALRGFDPIYVNGFEDVDLCLRAAELRPGHFTVVTQSRVTHFESKTPGRFAAIQDNRQFFVERWRGRLPESDWGMFEAAGFEVAWVEPGTATLATDVRIPRPVLTRRPRLVEGRPSLRWAIKISAHPGLRGDAWGDVFFADALAAALRRLGQEVVIDRRQAFYRSSAYLDDVTLTLRGLDAFATQAGATNLIWVISHPDLVSPTELASFDLAFAASLSWSRKMTDSGVRVEPLLQATGFGPGAVDAELPPHDVLFVGSSRKAERPVVRDAIAAGLDLAVYGQDWDGRLPAGYLRGTGLANDRLAAAYAAAGIVLCDHWGDMAREGFLSNRLFDAVASGARVISDDVAGISEVFGDSVATYNSIEELQRIAGAERADRFGTAEAREARAAQVVREHSFDARARTLLDAVLAHRG